MCPYGIYIQITALILIILNEVRDNNNSTTITRQSAKNNYHKVIV